MQTIGIEKRLKYATSFEILYQFRLHYYAGTQYPIMGELRAQYLSQNAGDIAQKYIRDPRLLSFIDVECFIVSTVNALQSPISMQAWFYMRHFCGIN
ncbi:prolycopene isomerase, chloroplastic [Capsicum galapagoense]